MLNSHLVTDSVCSTVGMLGMETVLLQPPEAGGSFCIKNDVLIAICLVGTEKYNLVFSMTSDTARKIAGRMMGTETFEMDEIGRSTVGELVNMVCGNLASALGGEFNITIPTVVSGLGVVCTMQSFESTRLAFQTPQGPFGLDLAQES